MIVFVIITSSRRRRLDPTSKSVAIIKSSDDEGKTWDNFRVISQNGWKGAYYYGTKGIYDQKRKRLIIQVMKYYFLLLIFHDLKQIVHLLVLYF